MSITEITRCILSAIIGYIGWTQLVPMIVVWGCMLLGLLGAVLVSFQEESISVMLWLHQATESVPGLHTAIERWFQDSGALTEFGGIHLQNEQLTSLFIKVWALLSLILFLLSSVWHWFRGTEPKAPMPLRISLLLSAVSAILVVILFALVLSAGGVANDISLSAALPTMILAILILCIVSLYSLTINTILSKLQTYLDKPKSDWMSKENIMTTTNPN